MEITPRATQKHAQTPLLKMARPRFERIKKAEQALDNPHTILDWYWNFTRGIWRKIGVNPEWVHGLDEITSLITLVGYTVSLIFMLSIKTPQGRLPVGAPKWDANLSQMVCKVDRLISANYSYTQNGIAFSGASPVAFAFNELEGATSAARPKVIFAVPRRLEPFNQEAYRSLTGAVNAFVCDVQSDLVDSQKEVFRTQFAFGFGETVEQIKNAARELNPETPIVINLLAQKGMDVFVGADNNYLSKLICPDCIRSSFGEMVDNVEQRLTNMLISNSQSQSVFDVTLQTFSKLGNHLEMKYDAETATLVEQEQCDTSAYNFYTQLNKIMHRIDKLFYSKKELSQLLNEQAVIPLIKMRNYVQQSVTIAGINISLNSSLLYFLAYVLTLPLAINLNVYHRRRRGYFLRSIPAAFNLRVLIAGCAVLTVLVILNLLKLFGGKHYLNNAFSLDVENLPKCCAMAVLVFCWIFGQIEDEELFMQRNTACLLLVFYVCAIFKQQYSLFVGQLIVLSHFGYWITEMAERKAILCRKWTVNCAYCLIYLLLGAALVYINYQLLLAQQLNVKNLQAMVIITCVSYALLAGFTGQIFKYVRGKWVCFIFVAGAVMYYGKLYLNNSVENQIIANNKHDQKISKLPSDDGFVYIKAFCDKQKEQCELFLESGNIIETPFVDGQFELFQGGVKCDVAESDQWCSVDRSGSRVLMGSGEWNVANIKVLNKVWFRGEIVAFVK